MGGRLPEPMTRPEYDAILEAIESWQWSNGDAPDHVKQETRTITRALWHTGCHPAVVTRRGRRWPYRFEHDGDSTKFVWRRPKNKKTQVLKLPDDLVQPLQEYLEGELVPYKTYYSRLRELAANAGLENPVYPMRFRHRVGLKITRSKYGGPGAAQRALGVSDKTLQHYVALSEDAAVDAAWKALQEDENDG